MRFVLLLIFLMTLSAQAYACRCAPPTERLMQEAYLNTDLIVRAKILSLNPAWNGVMPSARLEILETLKNGNDLPENFLINYNPSTAACGHDFKVGEEHLIGLYDTRNIKNKTLKGHGFRVVNSCDIYYLEHYLEMKKTEEKSE